MDTLKQWLQDEWAAQFQPMAPGSVEMLVVVGSIMAALIALFIVFALGYACGRRDRRYHQFWRWARTALFDTPFLLSGEEDTAPEGDSDGRDYQ